MYIHLNPRYLLMYTRYTYIYSVTYIHDVNSRYLHTYVHKIDILIQCHIHTHESKIFTYICT